MANKKSYFGGALAGIKTLLTGMDITMGEYATRKITEQYPENRKTQHIAERHRGTLVMPVDAAGKNKCTACTLCEKACPNGSISIVSQMITTEDGKVYIYYASSDTRLHVATTTVEKLMNYCFHTPEDPLRSVECVAQRCELIEKNLALLAGK